jgi:antagonist of KipI
MPLHLKKQEELISTAVTRGAIQLLPNGQMIVLMADHQSTGGYPVIGYIAGADFSSLAQLQAGESFLLEQTDLPCAEIALLKQQMNLQQLQNACNFRLK